MQQGSSALAKLANRCSCELTVGKETTTVSLNSTDEDVTKFYKALVKLLREHKGSLHDPQTGEDIDLESAGRHPSGWHPSRPFGRSFKAKAQSFLKDYSGRFDFVASSAWTAVRMGDQLQQGLYLQPGRGRRSGAFTLNVYWTFLFRPLPDPSAMSTVLGYSRFLGKSGLTDQAYSDSDWLPTAPSASLEQSFLSITKLLETRMLPLLDKVRTLPGLLEAFESGQLKMRDAFGNSALENIADSYDCVGRPNDAAKHYEDYLASYDESPDEHVQSWLVSERERAKRFFPLSG